MIPHNINIALTPLTSSVNFQYGTWDIEATDWWNLEIVGCWDGQNYYHFRTMDTFLQHIMQPRYKGWRWFAHFGGRYDLNFVFDHIRRNPKYRVSFYCSGSMVMKMSIKYGTHKQSRYDDHSTHLCDSFRLLPSSLRDLTNAFNVEHKKTQIDFENMVFGKEMINYNQQDCRGLYEVLESFFEQTGIRSETFASHALRYWRKEFLKETIYPTHQNVSDFVRKGYHGGRVEVFKRQSDSLNCYDVNSMYPTVMRNPVPTRYTGQSTRILDGNSYGFADVLVEIPDIYIPPLPVRYEKLYFPHGRIRAVWSTEELLLAESRGVRILKVFKAHYFSGSNIFKEFVDKLYFLKKTSTEPMRTIAKYLLNSLYGKFGQTPIKKVYVTERDAPARAYPVVDSQGQPSGFAYYERVSRAAYLLPHIAASITSKARVVLYSKLDMQSYYCDTDSIFTTKEMDVGSDLGQWSQVGNGDATFVQPKLYKFKGTWKAKGLNRNEDIDAFVNGGMNNVIRRKSIKEAMRDGEPACMDKEIIKRLGQSRPKRQWVGDDTRPWDVKELDERPQDGV